MGLQSKPLQVGTEILVDELRWTSITEITDDGYMVCDQDGAEFEITEAIAYLKRRYDWLFERRF